jgi:transcriptional regulator with XRE-family HTH domain
MAVPGETGNDRTSQPGRTARSVDVMDNRTEIRDFLTTRRARITPDQAGLPVYGSNRRVAGLRREEVAMLAGVSVDYYTRLERGNLGGVSESVLEALAQALHLDEAERAHLFDLARTANPTPASARRRRPAGHVRPGVQRILDAMATAPAYVRNGRLDVLAANRLGRAVFAPLLNDRERTPNIARFIFLDPASRDFYVDWERLAGDTVALLRAEAGRDPYDRDLTDLIGALSTRSETFRTWWAAHNVRFHRTGVKHLRHPVVGDLTLAYESMELTADQGLRLNAYSAEPGSPSQDALNVLASWTATLDQQEQPQAARATDEP